MERIPVESSNLHSMGYSEEERVLEVAFRNKKGGEPSVYQYANVPPEVWHGLLRAPSKGQWFSEHVKGVYSATRVA